MPKYAQQRLSNRAVVDSRRMSTNREVHASGQGLGASQSEALQAALGLQTLAASQRPDDIRTHNEMVKAEQAKGVQDEASGLEITDDQSGWRRQAHVAMRGRRAGIEAGLKLKHDWSMLDPEERRNTDYETWSAENHAANFEEVDYGSDPEYLNGFNESFTRYSDEARASQAQEKLELEFEEQENDIAINLYEATADMVNLAPEEQVRQFTAQVEALKEMYGRKDSDMAAMKVDIVEDLALQNGINMFHLLDQPGSDGVPPLSTHPRWRDQIAAAKAKFASGTMEKKGRAYGEAKAALMAKAERGIYDPAEVERIGSAMNFTGADYYTLKHTADGYVKGTQGLAAYQYGFTQTDPGVTAVIKTPFSERSSDEKKQIIQFEQGRLMGVLNGETPASYLAQQWATNHPDYIPPQITQYMGKMFTDLNSQFEQGEFSPQTLKAIELQENMLAQGRTLIDPGNAEALNSYRVIKHAMKSGGDPKDALRKAHAYLNLEQDWQKVYGDSASQKEIDKKVSEVIDKDWWFTGDASNTMEMRRLLTQATKAHMLSGAQNTEDAIEAAIEEINSTHAFVGDRKVYVGIGGLPQHYDAFADEYLEDNFRDIAQMPGINIDPENQFDDYILVPHPQNKDFALLYEKDALHQIPVGAPINIKQNYDAYIDSQINQVDPKKQDQLRHIDRIEKIHANKSDHMRFLKAKKEANRNGETVDRMWVAKWYEEHYKGTQTGKKGRNKQYDRTDYGKAFSDFFTEPLDYLK